MSSSQFKTFYWPTLRKLMMALIDAGLIPVPLWEADCTSRLETIADIPRGKAVYWFERTDLVRAKEVLGDVVCLRGNVPTSLMVTGRPDEVDTYCRRLIEKVGRGGGLILDAACGIPDEAKPENVRAMFEAARKYSA
jgi:uroporphyrinogen-III decarboxylase